MKLSQKLLALSGVAFADYACCPYDDYGIPSDDCGISEKTPFSSDDSWNGNSCKAWEANVDASFDGNDNDCTTGDDDWSSCGFQRHFSWIAANAAAENQQTGAFVLQLDTVANGGAALSPVVPLAINGGTDTDSYTVGGSPWHQGVCKLFIPVPSTSIASVSIAGVHISGVGPSVFDAQVRDAGSTYSFPGTAYCFSVVNPAEFLSNYNGGDNYLNNGNVAGLRGLAAEGDLANLANDPFDDLTSETARQAGVANPFFGGPTDFTTYEEVLTNSGALSDATDDSIVKKGANFDVVAHFTHSYCTGFWTKEDMQMTGDWNNNDGVPADVDYPLTGPLHTHTDTVDKRFASPVAAVSFNGFYGSDGTTMRNNADNMDVRWPNVGAYAGFYSFVACANADESAYDHANYSKFVYMIGQATAIADAAGCNGNYANPTDVQTCLETVGINKVVPSLGNSMWRYECEDDAGFFNPAMRFNIRQAGSNIRNCGPGTMPDNDGTRCSWNWNFTGYNQDNGNNLDAEGYFHRSNPKSFEVWDATTNARLGNIPAWGSPTALTQTKTITVSIDNRLGNLGAAETLTWANDLPSQYVGTETFPTGNEYTFELICLNPSGVTRDVFPDCFQGEEIHLSATVAYPVNYAGSWTDVMADPWLTTASVA